MRESLDRQVWKSEFAEFQRRGESHTPIAKELLARIISDEAEEIAFEGFSQPKKTDPNEEIVLIPGLEIRIKIRRSHWGDDINKKLEDPRDFISGFEHIDALDGLYLEKKVQLRAIAAKFEPMPPGHSAEENPQAPEQFIQELEALDNLSQENSEEHKGTNDNTNNKMGRVEVLSEQKLKESLVEALKSGDPELIYLLLMALINFQFDEAVIEADHRLKWANDGFPPRPY